MIAYSYDIRSLTIAAALFGLGFSLPFPILLTMCVESAALNETGTNMSTFTSAIDTGIGLGAISLGAVLLYCDYTIIFLLCSIITLGNLMFYFKYSKTHLSWIGDNCMISPQVGIFYTMHPANPTKRNSGCEFAKPVTIGHNCWIGGYFTVNSGVSLEDNV